MAPHTVETGLRRAAEYVVIALAVLLSWQMVVALLAERAPVQVAVAVAPTSSVALVRAAQSEFEAGRNDNAIELARQALHIAPFNARALSIVGRVHDRQGRTDAADQALTLAGNWTLRDDPTHAWLTYHRLRQGNYASAFAHAETLVRRGSGSEPRLFEMFTVAAEQPVGQVALLNALSAHPPWRGRYLSFLFARPGSDAILGALALNLERSAALSDQELGGLFATWLGAGRITAIRHVQARLGRPRLDQGVWNGGFATGEGVYPLNWAISAAPGFSAYFGETGDASRGPALYAEYDGLGAGVIAQQLLLLEPGPAHINLSHRVSGDFGSSRVEWRMFCVEGDSVPIDWQDTENRDGSGWTDSTGRFTVPTKGCEAQWLQLTAVPGDRRRTVGVWFDDLSVAPAEP